MCLEITRCILCNEMFNWQMGEPYLCSTCYWLIVCGQNTEELAEEEACFLMTCAFNAHRQGVFAAKAASFSLQMRSSVSKRLFGEAIIHFDRTDALLRLLTRYSSILGGWQFLQVRNYEEVKKLWKCFEPFMQASEFTHIGFHPPKGKNKCLRKSNKAPK